LSSVSDITVHTPCLIIVSPYEYKACRYGAAT
jgi:hypothetical protein